MKSVLVVANLTLGGEELLTVVKNRINEGNCSLYILVPAGHMPSDWATIHDDDRASARARLATALERFGDLGVSVDGEIGDERVIDAIGDVMRQRNVDEIVLSTLPPGASRWLGMDVVSRVRRSVDVPVTHVVAGAEGT